MRPTEWDLFVGYFGAAIRGFGGIFVTGRRMLVEEKRWLTPDEFVETLGLCQFLPGANMVNVSVAVGRRFRGWTGALAALAGILGGPAVISIALAALFLHYSSNPMVSHAMGVVAAAAAGMVVGTAIKMAGPVIAKDGWLAVPIGIATLLAAAGLNRLGLSQHATSLLSPDFMLPAVAQGVLARAKPGNTDTIYLGASSVTTTTGIALAKTDPAILVAVTNADLLWINGTAGDGVTLLAT